jgi:hypothetical protein
MFSLFEWVFVSNDPTGAMRMSLVESFALVFVVFYVVWYGLFRLIRYKLGPDADAFAKRHGFDTYSDLSFQFVRNAIATVCVFLSWVFIVYAFTQMADIKDSLIGASVVQLEKQCRALGGTVACYGETKNYSGWYNQSLNISFPVNSSFPLPHSNSVIEGNQTNYNISD